MRPIRKAVFPVAGVGTRFLPATKASAKEMMPIVDKPLIQYAAEKPKPSAAPSNLAVIGCYILPPKIFNHLEIITPGAGREVQLTDAIAELLKEQPVRAYAFSGKRFDCGDKLGYPQATVEFGLRHPEIGEGFSQYLQTRPVHERREAKKKAV